MDLETENRIAAMLMREATELRRQAEKEGVLAYLRQPNTRARPNSRFLSATVLGVQQANRSVEVKEMWRVREKEKELDKRLKDTSRDKGSHQRSHRNGDSDRCIVRHAIVDSSTNASASCLSKREQKNHPEGLTNEELENFLRSSTKKRGRGDIGARMDDTGPYLPPCLEEEPATSPDVQKNRVIYGPQKPSSLKSYESSEEELREKRRKKSKKTHSGSSDKKQRGKEASKHKKKRSKEKSRHRH